MQRHPKEPPEDYNKPFRTNKNTKKEQEITIVVGYKAEALCRRSVLLLLFEPLRTRDKGCRVNHGGGVTQPKFKAGRLHTISFATRQRRHNTQYYGTNTITTIKVVEVRRKTPHLITP